MRGSELRHRVASGAIGIVHRITPLLLLVLAAQLAYGVAFVLHSVLELGGERHFLLFDDAMISMTYGRTLAEGHGLVWFPGAPRVQGFTNPLWTLGMAGVHAAVPARWTSLVVQLFGVLLVPLTALAAGRIHQELAPRTPHPWLVPLWVGFFFPLQLWSGLGSEAGFVALLLTGLAGSTLAAQRTGRVGWAPYAAMAVGIATRLDFAVFAAVTIPFLVHAAWREPRARRRALVGAGAVAAATLAVLGAQLAYYGEALPNTFHLKLGVALGTRLARGLASVHRFLADLSYPLLALGAWALVRLPARRASKALLVALIGSGLLYDAYVGGDAWEWGANANRFQLPIVPLLMTPVALAVDAALRWTGWRGRRAGVLAAGLAAVVLVRWNAGSPLEPDRAALRLREAALRAPAFSREGHDRVALAAGLLLRDAARRPLAVAVWSAGIAPYVIGEGRFIDLLGRSDPRIARSEPRDVPFLPGHVKWDLDYGIGEQDPDVCIGSWEEPPGRFRRHFREPVVVIQGQWPVFVKRRVFERAFVAPPERDRLLRRYAETSRGEWPRSRSRDEP